MWLHVGRGLLRRNPLESGQCFLQGVANKALMHGFEEVAIPSNRVNVSYGLFLLKLFILLT